MGKIKREIEKEGDAMHSVSVYIGVCMCVCVCVVHHR